MKKLKVVIVALLIVATVCLVFLLNYSKKQVLTIRNERELLNIAECEKIENDFIENLKELAVFNAKKLYSIDEYGPVNTIHTKNYNRGNIVYEMTDAVESSNSIIKSTSALITSNESQKDYSKTNIQVENVDEADINKTDGNYIYSISGTQVIITDVQDPQEIKIASKINTNSTDIVPVDLMLYKNKLVVIYSRALSHTGRYYSNNKENTVVKTYNIDSKTAPYEVKSFEIHAKYYTSRCIENKLYVISYGKLRVEDDVVDRVYKEDGENKEISLKSISYLKDAPTDVQTIITTENIDDPSENIKNSSFLMDVSNCYISEKSIYLINEKRSGEISSNKKELLKKLFSLGGVVSFKQEYEYGDTGYSSYSNKLNSEIYKFDIEKDGNVVFKAKNSVDGKTINQYSMDEKDGHFRIATYDYSKGAKVTIYDENLKEIGHSDRVGKNENMYSTRFMGNKVYLVTYKTIDPLFVIDISNEAHPKVLGELSIPGYSNYLHPYDENHLIGIGMETKETVRKDSNGRVLSTTARVVGMKMALFDVTDVRNPKQISQVVIGNSRTTSAILTNPKALLFSKEKELIAIPVNNYNSDFQITNSDSYETIESSYKSQSNNYISEGYCVYKINANEGFSYKGTVTHEATETNKKYSYRTQSKLLRGLYIENNLYTISENKIKVNNLDNLEQISELNLINKDTNIIEEN